jgi:hypothetical protein
MSPHRVRCRQGGFEIQRAAGLNRPEPGFRKGFGGDVKLQAAFTTVSGYRQANAVHAEAIAGAQPLHKGGRDFHDQADIAAEIFARYQGSLFLNDACEHDINPAFLSER